MMKMSQSLSSTFRSTVKLPAPRVAAPSTVSKDVVLKDLLMQRASKEVFSDWGSNTVPAEPERVTSVELRQDSKLIRRGAVSDE